MGVAILKVIHISDYAQTWNEIYVAVVHGMDIPWTITSCYQLTEKCTVFFA